jgi:hypothetical protein
VTPSRAKKGESRLDRSRQRIALYARAFGSIPSYGDSNPGTRRKGHRGPGVVPPALLEAVGVTSGVRPLDALVNRVYGRPTERIEQVTGESEIKSALKQLSKEDLQAMVQQGRQEQEVKAIMRVMTAEERDELLGRMTPEERREILEERELAEQRERERREEMRLRGDDPDDPRPKETGTPEDFAWKDRRKARLRAVQAEAIGKQTA